MNWLINFSSPQPISWWIDDWGHSNKFKYAWNYELKNFPWFYLTMGWGCFMSKAHLVHRWIRVSLEHKPQTLWLALIKMMNWDAREAYLMDESFGNHYHACYHLLLTMSLYQWSPRSFGPCDCSSYKTKDVSDIFLCFWLVSKIRKAIMYNTSMLGGLKPLTQISTLGLRSQTCCDPWGNALVQ
jgi:hypothetical protein